MLLNRFFQFDQKISSVDLLLLRLQEDITCNFLDHSYLQMIKQKAYLLLDNLDQLKI